MKKTVDEKDRTRMKKKKIRMKMQKRIDKEETRMQSTEEKEGKKRIMKTKKIE